MSLRARLEQGEVVFGCFTLMVEPVWVEVLGQAGFDFVILDCEEAPGDSYGARLEELVRACQASGSIPTARIVENTPGAVNRGLNAGNELLYIPHIRSAEAAAEAVSAARYPPLGRRGAAPMVRAARYGLDSWDDYLERANADSLLIMMIEDLEGVANIEEIVQVPGVDGVLVGTWDLAVEMGCADYGPPPPPVMEHVETVIEATRRPASSARPTAGRPRRWRNTSAWAARSSSAASTRRSSFRARESSRRSRGICGPASELTRARHHSPAGQSAMPPRYLYSP